MGAAAFLMGGVSLVSALGPVQETGRAVEAPSVSVARAEGVVVPTASYHPGEMTDEALATLEAPDDSVKWVGMTRGADGRLKLDQVVSAMPSPEEQQRAAER